MKELYDEHPLPWVVDDNRKDYEGVVAVFDAKGEILVQCGDMEDCTYGDILNARLWAAAPDLLHQLGTLIAAIHYEREKSDELDRAAYGEGWGDATSAYRDAKRTTDICADRARNLIKRLEAAE